MTPKKPMSLEHRAKIAAAKRGSTLPPEVRKKISDKLKGRQLTQDHREKIGVALVGNKRGSREEVGYSGAHHRARAAVAHTCEHCHSPERLSAALRHDGSPSARRVTHRDGYPLSYSINPDDYMALCWPCHRAYDGHAAAAA